ncbi:hypothetical protein MN116_004921 [Schistosoma mekongi]|uniref:acid phosphatase n=1 Tax=Schistosoma mekongi TaxID=38744 RepID=A0AAE1ZCX2_SCHME|nr:hypothetical protein MN116_004921 [Schistosoma mekongi]
MDKFTKSIRFILFISCNTLCTSFIVCEKTNSRKDSDEKFLRHVHLVYHHGDSSPANQIPELYNNFESIWPEGTNKLTVVGIRQHFLLGRWMRQKYGDFVPEIYNSSNYHLRSTDNDKNLMSAMANSAGFYELPTSLDTFGVHWSPIPVHTISQNSNILFGSDECIRLQTLRKPKLYINHPTEFEQKHKNLFETLKNNTGLSINRFNVEKIANFIKCMKNHNVTLPSWCTKEILNELFEIEDFYWMEKYTNTSLEIIRLEIGLFLNSFIQHIYSIIQGKTIHLSDDIILSNKHIIIYSLNDHNLGYLLTALNIFNNKPIEYATLLSLEIYGPLLSTNISQFLLKIFYKNGYTDNNGVYLSLSICKQFNLFNSCPLDFILNYLQTLSLNTEQYINECLSNMNSLSELNATIIIIIYLFIIIMIVILLMFVYLIKINYTFNKNGIK